MTSHELARKLLEQPDVRVLQPIPETRNSVEEIEELLLIPKDTVNDIPLSIILQGNYHLEAKRKYLESLK